MNILALNQYLRNDHAIEFSDKMTKEERIEFFNALKSKSMAYLSYLESEKLLLDQGIEKSIESGRVSKSLLLNFAMKHCDKPFMDFSNSRKPIENRSNITVPEIFKK